MPSQTSIVMMLNYKSLDTFKVEGVDNLWGIGDLPTSKVRRSSKYIIVCCNRNHLNSEFTSDKEHGSAYMIAEIERTVPINVTPKPNVKRQAKYCRVLFRRYALLESQVIWSAQKNMIKYTSLEELADDGFVVDVSLLEWKSIDNDLPSPGSENKLIAPLNKEQAQECLALHYGLRKEQIKLTVELV